MQTCLLAVITNSAGDVLRRGWVHALWGDPLGESTVVAALTIRASRVSLSPAAAAALQPLQIKSVVAPEHVKGYIYVEAYKQTHVKQAIEGVGNLRLGYWNQQMVPIKEMTDVLKVVKEVANLKPKSWVRLKRGIYKDDIAQVPGVGVGRGG